MANAWKLKENNGIAELELDQPGTEVNVLDFDNLKELAGILSGLKDRKDVKALLFTSAKKKIFIAGADIKLINAIETKDDAFAKAEAGKAVFQLIEDLPFPTAAVINGPCLGGGYELVLACDWRLASSAEQVRIGLPEVNLGILPGFGGCLRLPRLVGLEKSLSLILGAKMVSAKTALKMGMIDRIFEAEKLLEESLQFAAAAKKARKACPLRMKWESLLLGPLLIYPAAKKNVLRLTKGNYPAPLKTLSLISRTYGKCSKEAGRLESQGFADLAVTPVAKNLIKLFFLSENYKKRPWTALKEKFPAVKECGIVGAGVMGGGIAQLASDKGVKSKLKDINAPALQTALNEANKIYSEMIEKGRLTAEERDRKTALISIDAKDEEVAASEFIIEAVVEDIKIKKIVFKHWDEKTAPETVLASNTSSLPVTEMARDCRYPERVVGLHFFNPVHRMPLVEVIRAEKTSDAVLEKTVQFSRQLGKTVIVTKDAPGFLVNRLLLPYLNEAAFLMQEGVPPEKIDSAAKKFGMPMGPVELVDQVGIDVGYKVAHILEEAFGSRMKVAGILEKVKSKGLLGKKAGKGFYIYDGKKKTPNPEIEIPQTAKIPSSADITKRLIYIMINEAARCLDEKVIDEAGTVDVGMIYGTGFPPFRGGLLRYADSIGLKHVVNDLTRLSKQSGAERFAPCAYLRGLADNYQSFYGSK